jgi:hypothetical protein
VQFDGNPKGVPVPQAYIALQPATTNQASREALKAFLLSCSPHCPLTSQVEINGNNLKDPNKAYITNAYQKRTERQTQKSETCITTLSAPKTGHLSSFAAACLNRRTYALNEGLQRSAETETNLST